MTAEELWEAWALDPLLTDAVTSVVLGMRKRGQQDSFRLSTTGQLQSSSRQAFGTFQPDLSKQITGHSGSSPEFTTRCAPSLLAALLQRSLLAGCTAGLLSVNVEQPLLR